MFLEGLSLNAIYRGQERRNVVLMNPVDIRRFGLIADQPVMVRSAVGTCVQSAGGPGICGSNPVKGSNDAPPSSERAVTLDADHELGYDGTYWVGALTATPPAYPP